MTLAIVAGALAKCGALRANELPGLSVVATPGGGAGSTDVTAGVEVLGEPFKSRWFGRWTYARNVWDMQVYDGGPLLSGIRVPHVTSRIPCRRSV